MAKNILVVDKAAFMRAMIKDILNKAGYNVIADTGYGTAAVEMFKANKPDLVTLDIRLPDMGGIEVLKTMRELDPDVPVIVCSLPEHAKEAFEAGAEDFVEKPFKPKMLTLAVQCALGDSSGTVSAAESSAAKFLIVDRSDSMRAVIREMMNDVCYCEIAEAKNGRTALEMFQADKPDAVFMEIQLPDTDGLDVCREMRRIDASVPVVILERQEYVKDMSVVDEAIRAGAKDFIVIPFKEDRFKKTVKCFI